MKRRYFKFIIGSLITLMAGNMIYGCSDNSTNSNSSGGLSGSLTISGSSALLPLVEVSIESFNEKYPDVEINAQAGGSGTGLTQVSEGSVDIGNSDVPALDKLDEEQAAQLVDHKAVAQGFGIVLSKDLGIDNLSKEQIQGIFSGKIVNWNEVGGPDREVFVIHRKSGSGTRATFEKTLLDGDKSLENDAIGVMQDSNGAVLQTMKVNDGAVSYLGLCYVNSDQLKNVIKVVTIDNVEGNNDNIINGSYDFWAYGHMYTKGEAVSPAKEFLQFISSSDNSDNLEDLGFISGSEIKSDKE